MFQLYLLNERNGQEPVRASDGRSRNTDAVFSRDGKWLAWTSVASDSPRYRILVADANDPKTRVSCLKKMEAGRREISRLMA
jgi:Tol biopolymer transport system component